MASALVLATMVVPLYTGLLHGWIYLQRRSEAIHLWLAVAALGLAAIAAALIGHDQADTIAEARRWQSLQIGAGPVLLIGFVRWLAAFLGQPRPRLVTATWIVAAATLAGIATDSIFAHHGPRIAVLPGGAPVPMAALTPAGLVLVAAFVYFVGAVTVELALASRRRRDARPVMLAYLVFAATLVHDAARGAGLTHGPELIACGYLVMVVGISAVQVRRFVRSMEETERLTSHLHERVEERSEELRRKELQLIHGERLATLGTLAAGVAHEINDPMAFVSSNLNRVEEIWDDPRERADVPEILAECHEGLARLRATVSELLRLARGSDAGMLPVDLSEIVSSVLRLVQAEARWRARLECHLEPVPAVQGNPGLLAQVALQLVLNGIRSAPEDHAARHLVRVSTCFEGGFVRLRVRDGGPPLPTELLPHLFDPFASLAVDATAQAEGVAPTGTRLGLAVSHQIVRQHGGEIEVESGSAGTAFTVSLPMARAPAG